MMVVAVDPGVTTGIAIWDDKVGFDSFELNEHDTYMWFDECADAIKHCQVEQFVINAATVRKTVVYDSLYIIGYLRYLAQKAKFPLGFTKPADVMASFPDAALKRAKMFNKGHGHANDAARHLAHYLVRNRILSGADFLPK